MDQGLLLPTLAIVVLLFLSAFFSGSETALTGSSRARIHQLSREGNRRARLVDQLWERKDRLIGAILLGNNLVNILASALATSVLIRLFGDAGVAYATLVMTLMVLIFAEVLPKTYAIHNADKMALAISPQLRLVVALLAPVTQLIHLIVRGTLRVFGLRLDPGISSRLAEEELRGAIELFVADQQEVRQERAMLHSILDLSEVEVSEIMTHRSKVGTVDIGQSQSKIMEAVLSSPFTRLPLWRDDPDNIVGVLHAKQLFRALHEQPESVENVDVAAIASPAWFIPEGTNLLSQLQAFRARREHFAIVVDEYGEVLGVVTLEYILEEIVGEIADEYDIQIEGVRPTKDGGIVVDGDVTIRDLNRQFDWQLPDEEASTIAGLVLHEARTIPNVGQVFVFHKKRFEVLGRERNQITSIRITQQDAQAPKPAPKKGRAAGSA